MSDNDFEAECDRCGTLHTVETSWDCGTCGQPNSIKVIDNWKCDTCGEQTTSEGMLVWKGGGEDLIEDFRIVHQGPCDPGDEAGFLASMPLTHVVGAVGQQKLLSFLSAGPIIGNGHGREVDHDAFVDVFRRLHTPWYEEARTALFHDHRLQNLLNGYNQYAPYIPEMLRKIVSGAIYR